MGLEVATYIHELVASNPIGASDPKSQGDDHLRLIKSTLQNTFANVDGPVTSSHTELNKLTGVTATTAEINKLAGLTATTTQLNILTGATLSTAELNILDGVTASTAELNILDGVTSSTAELNILDGVTVAAADINKLANITSGTYTPSVAAQTNCSVGAPTLHTYSRSGNTVTVFGSCNVTPSGAGFTSFRVSLPVASNMSGIHELVGNGGNSLNPDIVCLVNADTVNDQAVVQFNALASGAQTYYYHFHYRVN